MMWLIVQKHYHSAPQKATWPFSILGQAVWIYSREKANLPEDNFEALLSLEVSMVQGSVQSDSEAIRLVVFTCS